MARRSTAVIAAAFVVTAALTVPFVTMRPTSSATQDPGGEVFDVQALAADRFASRAHRMVFIVEAREGDVLRREPLLELLRNTRALRASAVTGAKLLTYPDRTSGREIRGLATIADAVEARLRLDGGPGLEGAAEEQVLTAVSEVLARGGPERFGLSVLTRRQPGLGRWTSPALVAYLLADNNAFGGGGQVVTLGSDDTGREEYARDALALLRGEQQHLQVRGLAIDVNLTAAEQGASAGPYIGLTILAVLLLVGLTFRSYWAVVITGGSLGALIIWLVGLCNLIGLKRDLILDTIVPIAMISFGVDYVFHAIGRYREEQLAGAAPRPAMVAGLSSVLGALVLAGASDAAAFLSNTTTGIESLVQFGVAAAIGTLVSFLLLGVVAPLAFMRVEERLGSVATARPTATALRLVGALFAALTAMAVVVLGVFIDPFTGAAALAVYLVVFAGAPLLILRPSAAPAQVGEAPVRRVPGRSWGAMGRAIVRLARLRWLVFPVVGGLTLVCVYFAHQIRADFDVRDFFSHESDFVVALDRFDQHVGDQGGEPAQVYIEADLTRPDVLLVMAQFAESIRGLDTGFLARGADGRVRLEPGALGVLQAVLEQPAARAAVAAVEGVEVTDVDGDGVPDTADQVAAVYRFTRAHGVPLDQERLARSSDDVRTVVWLPDGRGGGATVMTLRLPGSRSQETTEAARRELEPLITLLERRLLDVDPGARAVLTGAPIVRLATLDAILWAFRLSIPVAMVLCLIVSALFMRSLRYAAVSIVPILVVIAWLYAFMYLAGFGVNVVTATIGAISIGIGIDYAVHLTMRFREELTRTGSRGEALEVAGSGTGGALTGSALSSVVGFAILGLAPMPMFATYGLLTAVMIVMALAASLFVLPSLLFVVTPRKETK